MQSSPETARSSRRVMLVQAAQALTAIGVLAIATAPAAAAEKKKGKASKDDFFFQDSPGEKGRSCSTCVNFEPVGDGEKGTCALIEGEVCRNCYCQGWSDKKAAKKPGA